MRGAARARWPARPPPGRRESCLPGLGGSGTGRGSRRRRSRQLAEQAEPVEQLAGGEEVGSDVLPPLEARGVGADGIGEEVDDPFGALLDRIDEEAVVTVEDLELDAA